MADMEKRLGFHYFQDYDHYQARDLELWIPELASLQASWLVLKAPAVAARLASIPMATPINATPTVPADPQDVPVHTETTAVTSSAVT